MVFTEKPFRKPDEGKLHVRFDAGGAGKVKKRAFALQ
jgi:hypothetical protein